jgi:hypothetical protein
MTTDSPKHWSDCAVHSEPAYPKGECDCGGYEPVAIIHRNEYNEYRLEPHDSFDIKSIPFNVDVPLFKSSPQQYKPLTDEQKYKLVKEHLGLDQRRDDTVIDRRTGKYTDAARYFDLINAAIEIARCSKE